MLSKNLAGKSLPELQKALMGGDPSIEPYQALAAIEKLVKAEKIGPRQWPKAEALVVRAAGKPHVAPESDPRPALDVAPVSAAEFQPVDDML